MNNFITAIIISLLLMALMGYSTYHIGNWSFLLLIGYVLGAGVMLYAQEE